MRLFAPPAPAAAATPTTSGNDRLPDPVPATNGLLRRRGLIAGAAALAAATLAAHPDPVAAAPLVGTANGYTGGTDANQDGVQGYTAGAGNAGAFGRNNDLNGVGVSGAAPSGIGVSGSSGSGPGLSGTSTSGPGAFGTSPSNIGVYGTSTSSYGVAGGSTSGHGVLGQSTSGYGVAASTTGAGKAALYGIGSGAGTKAAELHGDVDIWGVTRGTTTAGHAVIGGTSQASCAGVLGIANAANTIGVVGSNNNIASAYAAQFFGAVLVVGDFAVTGAKNAAVPFPDGSRRLMYSVEAPEAWFEDFGEAALTNGRAVVRLDPDFAQTVLVDNYHVFLTAYGDAGLFVAARTATSFTVQERGGAGGVTFSWRVVAKRKDVASPRLARVVAPDVLAPPPAGTAPKIPDDLAMPKPLPDTGLMVAKPFPVTAPAAMPLAGPTLAGPMVTPEGNAPARATPGVGVASVSTAVASVTATPQGTTVATPTSTTATTATPSPSATVPPTSMPTATATSGATATRPPATPTSPAPAVAPAAVIPATTPALTATPRPTTAATPGATSTSTSTTATTATTGASVPTTTGTTGTGTATVGTPAAVPVQR